MGQGLGSCSELSSIAIAIVSLIAEFLADPEGVRTAEPSRSTPHAITLVVEIGVYVYVVVESDWHPGLHRVDKGLASERQPFNSDIKG